MILVGMSAFAERFVNYYEMDGTPVYADFDADTWYDASESLGYTWTGLRNLYSPVEITYRDFTFTRDIKGVERLYYKGEFQFACRDQLKDGYVLFVAYFDNPEDDISDYAVTFIDGRLVLGDRIEVNDMFPICRDYHTAVYGLKNISTKGYSHSNIFRVLDPAGWPYLLSDKFANGKNQYVDCGSSYFYNERKAEYLYHYGAPRWSKENHIYINKVGNEEIDVSNLWGVE